MGVFPEVEILEEDKEKEQLMTLGALEVKVKRDTWITGVQRNHVITRKRSNKVD